MSKVIINGNNFSDFNKAKAYLDQLEKNEEKELRLSKIETAFDVMINLIHEYEKDYDGNFYILYDTTRMKDKEVKDIPFNKPYGIKL